MLWISEQPQSWFASCNLFQFVEMCITVKIQDDLSLVHPSKAWSK